MFHPLKLQFFDKTNNKEIFNKKDLNENSQLLISLNESKALIKKIVKYLNKKTLFFGDVFYHKKTNTYFILTFKKENKSKLIEGFQFEIYLKQKDDYLLLDVMNLKELHLLKRIEELSYLGNLFMNDNFLSLNDEKQEYFKKNIYNIFLVFYNQNPLHVNILVANYSKYFDYKDNHFELAIIYKDKKTYLPHLVKNYPLEYLSTHYSFRYDTLDVNDFNEKEEEDSYFYLKALTGDLLVVKEDFEDVKNELENKLLEGFFDSKESIKKMNKIIDGFNESFIGFNDDLNLDFIYTNKSFPNNNMIDVSMQIFTLKNIYNYSKYTNILLKVL